jgi:hypothetical protein
MPDGAEPVAAAPMPFDVEGARAAGYSDGEIANYVGGLSNFNTAAARKAGYANDEIISHLAFQPKPPPEPTPPSSTLGGVGKALAQAPPELLGGLARAEGAGVTSAGTAIQSAARNAEDFTRQQVGIINRIDAGESVPATADPLGYADASTEQRTQIRQRLEHDIAALPAPEDTGLGQAGGAVKSLGESLRTAGQATIEAGEAAHPLTDEEQGRLTVRGVKLLTGLAPYLVASLGGPEAVAGLAGLQGFGSHYDAAKKAGSTDEQAATAALFGGVSNAALMTVPIGKAMEVAGKLPNLLKGEFFKTVGEMAKSSATGVTFTQLQTVADNLLAQQTYAPDRSITQDVGKDIGLQAAVFGFLPVAGAGVAKAGQMARRVLPGRPNVQPRPAVQDVLNARDLDTAIDAANDVATTPAADTTVDTGISTETTPVDATAHAATLDATDPQQAKLLRLFDNTGAGTVEQADDGGYHFRTTDANGAEITHPIEVWNPGAPGAAPALAPGMLRYYHGATAADASTFSGKTFVTPHENYARDYRGGPNNVLYFDISKDEAIARGLYDDVNNYPINGAIDDGAARLKPLTAPTETGGPTISPETADALRAHYGQAGVDVVFYKDHGAIPFDGAVDPAQPDTIFLSSDPARNVAQVAGHEFTHVLQTTTLPDGTSLGDLLNRQIAAGITPAGQNYARAMFGSTAPERGAFPAGPEGDATHAAAVQAHLINELGVDIGGEAPKFQSFLPRVVDAIQQRFGDSVAGDVLGKLIDGLRSAMETVRGLFGETGTRSQIWVSNVGEVHDTLAKMYAERFGTQLQREQAAVAAMRNGAARQRLLATLRARPAEVTAEVAAPAETSPAVPAPAPGMLRYYHGTTSADASGFTGKTFVTPQENYARDYRGGPNNVLYFDISRDEAIARGLYDEVNDHPINGAIDDGAARLKPLTAPETGAPAEVLAPRIRTIQQIQDQDGVGARAAQATQNAEIAAVGRPITAEEAAARKAGVQPAEPTAAVQPTAATEAAGAALTPSSQIRTGATPFLPVPKEPERLAAFLRRMGGIQDPGGDVRSSLGGARMRPGLINHSGMSHNDALVKAWEGGYFPESGDTAPIDEHDLIDKLHDDVNGRPVYSHHDDLAVAGYTQAIERNREMDLLAEQHGIPTAGITHAQFMDQLSAAQLRAADQVHGDAAQGEYNQDELAARDEIAPENWHAGDFYGRDQGRTLEDMERERESEEAAHHLSEFPPGDAQRGAIAPDAGGLPEGGGARPGGAGGEGRTDAQGGGRPDTGTGVAFSPRRLPRPPQAGADLFRREPDEIRREYAEADAAVTAGHAAWQAATDAYRARKIGDAEYLAARQAHDALMARFDRAFEAMQSLPPERVAKPAPEPTIRNDARQADMFGRGDAAVQAQAARDQTGRGALLPKGEQKPADEGLFKPAERGNGVLFSPRPVADIRSDQIAAPDTPERLQRIREWAYLHLGGQRVRSDALGADVTISRSSIRKTLNRAGNDILSAVPAIPDLIAHGERIGKPAPPRNPEEAKSTLAWHLLGGVVSIDGRDVPMVVHIHEDHAGHFFYSLNRDRSGSVNLQEASSAVPEGTARSSMGLTPPEAPPVTRDVSPDRDQTLTQPAATEPLPDNVARPAGSESPKGDVQFSPRREEDKEPLKGKAAEVTPDGPQSQSRPQGQFRSDPRQQEASEGGTFSQTDGERKPQTETPAFKAWFGASRVVDASGQPQVVYHATDADIASFSRRFAGQNTDRNATSRELAQTARLGHWFSDRTGVADSMAANAVYPVYLRIENPLVTSLDDLVARIRDAGSARRLIAQLKADGYDGLSVADQEFGGTSHVAFEATQIKSAVGNRGTFDPSDTRIQFSPRGDARREEDRTPLYSALTRAVEGVRQEKATPGQWIATLKNMPGVKPEERAWTGLDDWLGKQPKSVTKAEVLDYLRANSLDVREVMKGGDEAEYNRVKQEIEALGMNFGDASMHRLELAGASPDLVDRFDRYVLQGLIGRDATHFGQYTTPGGENYRELLITLPERPRAANIDEASQRLFGKPFLQLTMAERVEAQHELSYNPSEYRTPHWDEANVLAHIRFSERDAPDGTKTLLVDEVQSDQGQQLRKVRSAISDVVDRDFEGIVKRMQGAGVLKVECN